MLLAFLLTTASVFALQVPAGWTQLSIDRALLDAKNPAMGELREFSVPGGNGDAAELVKALKSTGITAQVVSQTPDSTITLRTNDSRVIQARASVTEGKARWYVVMAANEASAQLDTNALLTTMQSQIPIQLAWGEQVEVLPAGGDGSLWGVPGSDGSAGRWTAGDGEPAFATNSELYGFWTGALDTRSGAVEVKLLLEANGRARLEKVSEGRMCVSEGTWGVQADQLKIAYYTGDPLHSPYKTNGRTLTFTLEERTVELRKVK